MAVCILKGKPASFRWAFILMIVATLIDATDGTLARLVGVKAVLPGFDGRRLDDLIDFQTYTALPLLLLLRAQVLPDGQEVWLLLPLLASAYGFCQTAVKTEDGFFLGFPSYWNVIAFYVYVLEPPAPVPILVLALFSILTFVPLRYLYPTQGGRFNRLTNLLGVVWCALLVWVLARVPEETVAGPRSDEATRILALVSLFFPAYYLGTSWLLNRKVVRS